jgi:hypothetical protein
LLLLSDQFQHIAGLGDMREINLRFEFVGVAPSTSAFRGRGSGALGRGTEMRPHLFRLVIFQRAGMGFLLGNPYFRQYIENGLALDFELSGQIVDSNLTHQPFSLLRTAP